MANTVVSSQARGTQPLRIIPDLENQLKMMDQANGRDVTIKWSYHKAKKNWNVKLFSAAEKTSDPSSKRQQFGACKDECAKPWLLIH